MKIREEFKVREMAGEHVIVMPGRGGAADMTRTERYEVDADTARKDAGRWIASLAECGIVEE